MARQVSSGPYLITTSPSLIMCRCGTPVMAATVTGMDVHIDTACLTQLGEVMALLAGRSTYWLRGDHLARRQPEAITAGFPVDRPVMADHRCGQPIPPEHINEVWTEVATAIVVRACGGVIVGKDTIAHVAPF